MTDDATSNEDPAVVGVPPETPDAVRPSATGLVTGPVDGETDVEVAEIPATGSTPAAGDTDVDQILQDAEGGLEGSLLDAPTDELGRPN